MWSYLAAGAIMATSCMWYSCSALFSFKRALREARRGSGGRGIDLETSLKALGCNFQLLESLLMIVMFAVAGFAFLWWLGYIQEYVARIVMLIYFVCVVLAIAQIMVRHELAFFFKSQQKIEELLQ